MDVVKINESEIDLISGQRRASHTNTSTPLSPRVSNDKDMPFGPAANFRDAKAKVDAMNNDSHVDVITGRAVTSPRGLRVSRGSFGREIKEDLDPSIDPITLRPKTHAPIRQGAPPHLDNNPVGVFATFQKMDNISLRCPKCAKPIFISGVHAPKGAFIQEKAIYNTEKGGHKDCFYHPGKSSLDDYQKPEYALYTCCNGTLKSSGCQLKQ